MNIIYLGVVRRSLGTVTNANGSITTTTVTEAKEETRKMSIVYKIFYMMANMGGLYTILMFTIGVFLRPVINKMFNYDLVNDTHETNRKGLSKLKL